MEKDLFRSDEDSGDNAGAPRGGGHCGGPGVGAGDSVETGAMAVADIVGLDSLDPEDPLAEPLVPGAPDGGASAPPTPPAPPLGLSDISSSGYVYLGPRSVCRIQRRDDVGRLWVNCYQGHGQCRINVNLASAPNDAEILEWVMGVPPGTTAGPEERRALQEQHRALWRARFGEPGKGRGKNNHCHIIKIGKT